ncbi:DoxX family protein [Mesobacillus subterraneus]|uniref:DoxX family protein n=1 Tax=Mesobacillus subterraneus TaxID=285983 RepID=UPI00203FC1F5|nr:DoxX family protein [Mesobacillus subterraneus]MCM3666559.1 DoxX family protein [Mesobacillus subterraneus]MCM3685927.1 DoxX family protein [Mesobacillus subterraneus]
MSIASFVLKGILAFIFLGAGAGKVLGSRMHKENFIQWRLPQWFRLVTGIVELVGAGLLIIGFWHNDYAAAGAILLGFTAIGGVLTHLRVKDRFQETMPIAVIGICSFALFFLLI